MSADKDKWDSFQKEIDDCINGIGNLLLITPSETPSWETGIQRTRNMENIVTVDRTKSMTKTGESGGSRKNGPI